MIEYLKTGTLERPQIVSNNKTKGEKNGFVVSSFAVGSLFLSDTSGKVYRLVWQSSNKKGSNKKDSKAASTNVKSRQRALPPGEYKLIGYRTQHQDKTGKSWFITATSSKGIQKITVKQGKVATIKVSEKININCRLKSNRQQLKMIFMNIQGDAGSGLSIYREGKRIPIRYTIRDKKGNTIISGKMQYG